MTKVVLCVDESSIAEHAFNWYVEHIHKDCNEVLVVHAMSPVSIPVLNLSEGVAFPSGEISQKVQDQMKKKIDLENKYTMKCSEKKITNYKLNFNQGETPPGDYIVKYAKDNHADLIVMGTRGMGTIRRTILGSVSDYVVHHVKIPVLIAPAK